MAVNPIPTPTPFPIQFGQRDAKVIETATKAAGVLENKTLADSCVVPEAAIADEAVSLAKLAAILQPSHVIKFVETGITGTALAGLLEDDICVFVIAGTPNAISVAPCVADDTLPVSLVAADYVFVLRAAS